MSILRIQSTGWIRWVRTALWLASCAALLAVARLKAVADCTLDPDTGLCKPYVGSPTCLNPVWGAQFDACCTHGGTTCCQYECTNWTCGATTGTYKVLGYEEYKDACGGGGCYQI